MSAERANAVTLKGTPFTLVGPELKVGDKAPDFETVGKDLKPVGLADTRGSVRIFSVVPSLDTPVCDAQTRRFNGRGRAVIRCTDLHHQYGPSFRSRSMVCSQWRREADHALGPSKCPVRNSLRYPH